MVGKTPSWAAFREKAIRKTDYWDADPLQTPPAVTRAFTKNLGVVTTSCLAWIKNMSLATAGHLRAQTSARRSGCPVNRGCERCTQLQ